MKIVYTHTLSTTQSIFSFQPGLSILVSNVHVLSLFAGKRERIVNAKPRATMLIMQDE